MKSVLHEKKEEILIPIKMSIYNAFRSGKITRKAYNDFLATGYSKNQLITVGG